MACGRQQDDYSLDPTLSRPRSVFSRVNTRDSWGVYPCLSCPSREGGGHPSVRRTTPQKKRREDRTRPGQDRADRIACAVLFFSMPNAKPVADRRPPATKNKEKRVFVAIHSCPFVASPLLKKKAFALRLQGA